MIIDKYTYYDLNGKRDLDVNEIQILGGGPHDRRNVVAQRRRQRDGSSLWSVNEPAFVLDKEGDWVYEPLPSSRTDEYTKRTRWHTLDEAIAAFWRLDKQDK